MIVILGAEGQDFLAKRQVLLSTMATKLIIFVCVSNTCRSPMCEYLFRDKLVKSGLDSEFSVVSRSLSTDYEPQGSPANERGLEVSDHFRDWCTSIVLLICLFYSQVLLKEYGVNMEAHRSKLLSADDAAEAFLIIPVKRDLGIFIKSQFPQFSSKVAFLDEDVADPWRQPYPVYAACARQVDGLLASVLSKITSSER